MPISSIGFRKRVILEAVTYNGSENQRGCLWQQMAYGIVRAQERLLSYQHVGGTEVVLAGHALFQLLRHLLDVLNFI